MNKSVHRISRVSRANMAVLGNGARSGAENRTPPVPADSIHGDRALYGAGVAVGGAEEGIGARGVDVWVIVDPALCKPLLLNWLSALHPAPDSTE